MEEAVRKKLVRAGKKAFRKVVKEAEKEVGLDWVGHWSLVEWAVMIMAMTAQRPYFRTTWHK